MRAWWEISTQKGIVFSINFFKPGLTAFDSNNPSPPMIIINYFYPYNWIGTHVSSLIKTFTLYLHFKIVCQKIHLQIISNSTSFESLGPAIGGVIDGCPSGIELDMEAIQKDLNRRKLGQSAIVTQRKEPDEVEFFSGIFDGITTGVPIGFAIFNTTKLHDYDHIKGPISTTFAQGL